MRFNICFIISLFLTTATFGSNIVIDSNISLNEAIKGSQAPHDLLSRMEIVCVEYFSNDSTLHQGQIVVDRELVEEIKEIFEYIKEIKYPVEMVIPIKNDMPNGMTSMAKLNNSYSFHYRNIISYSKTLSKHSYGRAIDLNPFNNPFIYNKGKIKPEGAKYDISNKATLTANHPLVLKLKRMGWKWGGDWKDSKDYMHFEK